MALWICLCYLERFTQFYRENAQIWLQGYQYKESGPHLLLLAFLQRIINGGGYICREYALGSRRVDLFVRWKHQTFVLELKIKHSESVLAQGLEQTAAIWTVLEAKVILLFLIQTLINHGMRKFLMKSWALDQRKFMCGPCNG